MKVMSDILGWHVILKPILSPKHGNITLKLLTDSEEIQGCWNYWLTLRIYSYTGVLKNKKVISMEKLISMPRGLQAWCHCQAERGAVVAMVTIMLNCYHNNHHGYHISKYLPWLPQYPPWLTYIKVSTMVTIVWLPYIIVTTMVTIVTTMVTIIYHSNYHGY